MFVKRLVRQEKRKRTGLEKHLFRSEYRWKRPTAWTRGAPESQEGTCAVAPALLGRAGSAIHRLFKEPGIGGCLELKGNKTKFVNL